MATEDDKINEGALATLVAVGVAAMIGVSFAVNALVRHETTRRAAVRDEPASQAFRSLRAEAEAKLAAPAAWADAQKGLVALPIDRAMGLVIADLKRDPWSASPPPPVDAGADAENQEADAGLADDGGVDAEADAGAPETSDAGSGSEQGGPSGELGSTTPDAAPAPPAMTAAPSNPPKSPGPAGDSTAKPAPAPPASAPKPAKPASSASAGAAPKPLGSATAKPPAPTATAPKPAAPAPPSM